jgi:hypothetical protein
MSLNLLLHAMLNSKLAVWRLLCLLLVQGGSSQEFVVDAKIRIPPNQVHSYR